MEAIATALRALFDCSKRDNKLARCFWESFEKTGERGELDKSIAHERIALKRRPKGHPNRSKSLYDLARYLLTRYERWGQLEDLEEAIELNRTALELRPDGHPGRSDSLGNLANSLAMRYEQQGRAALELRPKGHPGRSISLDNLAGSLITRFEQLGATKDLEEGIELGRAALELRPEGHPHRSISLGNLATYLSTRYRQQGSTKDLEEAIELDRAALELRPKGHPHRSVSLGNLARSLETRFEQQGTTKDLEEAIELERATLDLLPEGHPDCSMSLCNLASSLKARYERQGGTKDLEEAIELHRTALDLRPAGHPHRSISLGNLASSLKSRYNQQGVTKDLEETIELQRAALDLRPEGHPHRSISCNNLANSLRTKYEQQGRTEDLEEECMRLLQLAATHEFSGLLDRLTAARRWATLARLHKNHTALSAYQTAMSILQRALTIRPTLREQHDFLTGENVHRTLTSEAASYAIEKNELEQAVETLEQGRGLLWSQMRGLRTPIDQLAETNEGLTDRFKDVNRRLEHLSLSHEALMSGSDMDGRVLPGPDNRPGQKLHDQLLRLKKELLLEQDGIINEIRQVPGYENFLKVTPFRELQQAASEGPIIMVNHNKYRSDALIIFRDVYSVVCIPLDEEFYEDSIGLCDELVNTRQRLKSDPLKYGEKLCEAMKMLWDRVVSKVVSKLTELGIAKGSRIWWCPTSVLSALPFHAAGPFKDSDGTTKYLLDDYISSYTPTLGALISARSNTGTSEPKLLVVGDTVTLRSTKQEIRNIQICMDICESDYTKLLNRRASRRKVMEMLRKVTWIHFACHGHLNPEPFDSSFKLADRGLTLLDIIQTNVPNAEFAFLSACHTAELSHSGVHDEALHLSAAMQFIGFRSVIGTMWELYDEDGPLFARVVYEYMNECKEGELKHKRAAGGLRNAALELKAREGIPTERWVNFIHIGA
ncbi:TPR-like protein [Fomitiporia mediterranea MF3/22]|uniref:TPR-like protein n=1 Tax=Fomitiporia mediterranea (strain MF3/22) TaxID=694068 RepID=UPI0004407731|nr:TPR-like protein [Fomitiporia mediterranea MF3/22]EJD06602.1 TPR-like protein [Fomitiporia mediterranea MF3/22]